jgi:hypothetical protein
MGCGGADAPRSVDQPNARFTALGTPRAGERFAHALAAIKRAAASGSCVGVRHRLSSVWKPLQRGFCRDFKAQLGTLAGAKGAVYGTGAVVDYTGAFGEPRALVLGLDVGGRYKMVYTMPTGGRTVGTKARRSTVKLAQDTVAALRNGDCDAFLRVAHHTLGLGAGDRQTVCSRLPGLALSVDLRANPDLEPRPLGANRAFAFYAIRVPHPRRYYTLVFARQIGTRKPKPASLAFSVFLPAG